MVWVISFCSPVAELNRWLGTQKMSGGDRSAQTRQVHIKITTPTPAYTTESNLQSVIWSCMSGWKPTTSLIYPPMYSFHPIRGPNFMRNTACAVIGEYKVMDILVIWTYIVHFWSLIPWVWLGSFGALCKITNFTIFETLYSFNSFHQISTKLHTEYHNQRLI